MNKLVQKRREQDTKTNKPRHIAHGRKLGTPKEKLLPYPGRATAITLNMIDPEWLDEHPESPNTCFITGYTKTEPEEDRGFDAGDEDEENLERDGGDWQSGRASRETFQESDEGEGSNFDGSNFGGVINAGNDGLDEHLREDFHNEGEDDEGLYAL